MAGRSNVGKSSLINALVKQKVARTSAAPGKTRLANYYLIESRSPHPESPLYLVDLPGYGYARGGAESAEAFGELTREYFDPTSQPGRQVGGVLHLIDARHPALRQDFLAHEWLLRRGAPVDNRRDEDGQAESLRAAAGLEDAREIRRRGGAVLRAGRYRTGRNLEDHPAMGRSTPRSSAGRTSGGRATAWQICSGSGHRERRLYSHLQRQSLGIRRFALGRRVDERRDGDGCRISAGPLEKV